MMKKVLSNLFEKDKPIVKKEVKRVKVIEERVDGEDNAVVKKEEIQYEINDFVGPDKIMDWRHPFLDMVNIQKLKQFLKDNEWIEYNNDNYYLFKKKFGDIDKTIELPFEGNCNSQSGLTRLAKTINFLSASRNQQPKVFIGMINKDVQI